MFQIGRSAVRVVPLIVGVSLFFAVVQASELPTQPLSKQLSFKRLATNNHLQLPALDLQSLRAASVAKQTKSRELQPLTFAQPYDYSEGVLSAGSWQTIEHEGQEVLIWRYQISSPNAYSLNLGFSKYVMPESGRLYVYADEYTSLIGPFTALDNETHGQLWTPVLSAKSITLEINILPKHKAQLQLELSKINQGYLDFENLSADLITLKSGSCNVDVVCPVGAVWGDQIRSVTRYVRSGNSLCTGAAINNVLNDSRPFILTANHCGIDAGNAPSIVAYWNYQNSTCRVVGSGASGGLGDGSINQFNSGAIFRAAKADSDVALIELDDPYLPSANVFVAGWSRVAAAPSSAVAIHHPIGEEKRISFENDALSIAAYGGGPDSGTTHLLVPDWDMGTTEQGSSGSPLFDPNKRIVGQLHGGFAACGNDDADWYGRFATSWDNGANSAERLKDWLDPNGSDAMVLDGLNAGSTPPLAPEVDDDFLLLLIPSIIKSAKSGADEI